MTLALGFDVRDINRVCLTCGVMFKPMYAFATRKYCSHLCSRSDPAKAQQRHKNLVLAAKEAARLRTLNARRQFCKACGERLKVADPRKQTCGAKACLAEIRSRRHPKTQQELRSMGRRIAGRKDANHKDIVSALEAAGCATIDISDKGLGLPDLIVWSKGTTYLVEVKNPKTSYGKQGANKNQKAWADTWPCPVWIISSLDDVAAFVNGRFKDLKWFGARPAVLGEAMR